MLQIHLYLKSSFIICLICLLNLSKTYTQNPIKVYVDPETTPGIKASKFIEKIDFIPLETSETSKYDKAQWPIITKDKFVIVGDQTLYFFDKYTGKFLHKYKNPQRKYKINSIQYVPEKDAIIVKRINKHYTISRTKALKLIKKWENRDISKYVSLEWLYLGKTFKHKMVYTPSIALNMNLTYFIDGYIYRNYNYDKYSTDSVLYRLVQYDLNNHIKKRYFPFLNLTGLWSYYQDYLLPLPSSTYYNDSIMLFQLDFSPDIYELREDTIVEKYKFILPIDNLMPANFNSLNFKNNIDYEKYKEKNADALFYYYSIIKQGNYLMFGGITLGYKNTNFILIDHTLYNLNKLTTDSSIYNLPPKYFSRFNAQDKDYLYVTMNADQMLEQKKNLLADKRISLQFKSYLAKMTKDDNPILIRIKLK